MLAEALKWAVLAILVLPVPFFTGTIIIKQMNKEQKTPAMAYICGWFLCFAVFEVTAIPFILLEKSFSAMAAVYTVIMAAVLIYALFGAKDVLNEYKEWFADLRSQPAYVKAGWAAVLVIIAAQMVYAVMYEYYDGDDAYYIAEAVLTDTFDTMYLRDAYTGYIRPLDVRHAFSPTPVYQAWLSRITGVNPAAIAHVMLAVVWLLLMYCVFAQIGARLLDREKKNYRPVFMLLIAVWFAFGNISIYTVETFAMTRTWQGKGLMAGIVLPALFLCLITIAEDKISRGSLMLLVCINLSAVFATSVAFMIMPTVSGLASVFLGFRHKSIKEALAVFAASIPCLLLGGLYLIMS